VGRRRRALQTWEMAFYRSCHAAQAWHVEQVLAAGQSALESMPGGHGPSRWAAAVRRRCSEVRPRRRGSCSRTGGYLELREDDF